MNRRFLTASVALSLLAGCGDRSAPPEPVAAPIAAPPAKPVRKLPEALYSITRDEEDYGMAPQRRMVDVTLSKRISPETLREIAMDVKGQGRLEYPRTLIWVYLPDPLPGVKGSLWATCHFEPTLRADRTGMTEEDEAKIRAIKLDLPGKRIGTWLMDVQFGGWLVAIFEDNGQIKVAETHGSPEPFISDIVELPADSGRRFKKVNGSEIYAVDEAGALRMYGDKERIFAGAMPLK